MPARRRRAAEVKRIVAGTGLMNGHQARIANLAAKARLPAIYTTSQFVDAGGLMSYAADGIEQYRGAPTM